MKSIRLTAIAAALLCALPLGVDAQVVREDGAKSIAGVLYTIGPRAGGASEWTFKSAGGDILFASLDADIYRVMAHGEEHTTTVTAAADTGGGCSGEEGGPGLFKLKVLDAYKQVLCEATRPAPPPGWQRDPRLACVMPTTKTQATYTIRVELANPKGEMVQPMYPFILNISLRKIAPSGTNIQSAIATSSTGGF
jgi:hypothetical protein